MHESFEDNSVAKKVLEIFFFYRFYALRSFLNKIPTWFLSLSCQMATPEFFLI